MSFLLSVLNAAGGNPEEEAEAREVCKEAEITTICADSVEAAEIKHLDSTPNNFKCVVADIVFEYVAS